MENQKLSGPLNLAVSCFHVRSKRSLKIGDFKPGVLLQPLISRLCYCKIKRQSLKDEDIPCFVWVLIKAGDGLLKTSGGPVLQTFLGSLCPALLLDKRGWVGKCCKVPAVLWEWRAPGPRDINGTQLPTGSGWIGHADPVGCPQKHRARELWRDHGNFPTLWPLSPPAEATEWVLDVVPSSPSYGGLIKPAALQYCRRVTTSNFLKTVLTSPEILFKSLLFLAKKIHHHYENYL